MLGKLIKYDLKSMNRFLIILHAFLLLIAVLLRVFVTSRIQLQTDEGSLLLHLPSWPTFWPSQALPLEPPLSLPYGFTKICFPMKDI